MEVGQYTHSTEEVECSIGPQWGGEKDGSNFTHDKCTTPPAYLAKGSANTYNTCVDVQILHHM